MSYQVFGLLILSVIFWGMAPVVEKMGFSRMDSDPFVALAIRSLSVILGLFVLAIGMGKTEALMHASPKTILFFALSGLLAGLLGTWCYLTALKMGAASRVVPLSATYPLVTVVLSCLLLREDFTWSRILGTLLVVGGISLLK